MCMADDGNLATLYREETRRAAKPYRCCECRGLIEKGASYVHTRILDEGSWSTMRTCAGCLPCRDWLLGQCNGYCWTGVYDDLVEHWSFHDPDDGRLELGRLIVGMRRRRRAVPAAS